MLLISYHYCVFLDVNIFQLTNIVMMELFFVGSGICIRLQEGGGGLQFFDIPCYTAKMTFFCINLYWLHISTCSSSRHRKYRIVDSNDIV